ncbi:MAG TPA: PEP-CTERM sorting domain-containing protein [Terriglobales bacterium]|nr:PEP-CTERM sorting domain-containing protein [Terriglobales bacterium]
MGSRLVLAVLFVIMVTSAAFAGPQIVISDPFCSNPPGSNNEILLNSGNYSFTVNGPTTLTFCNFSNPGVTFAHLNMAITFGSTINLASLYCGGPNSPSPTPETPGYPPFNYCAVMDPNVAPSGPEPFSNQALAGKLIHEFVVDNGDTPNNFFNNDQCFFGCNPSVAYLGNTVYLSFNVGGQHPQTGLLRGDTFAITLGCSAPVTNLANIPDPNCNDDLFKDATFSFNVGSNPSSTQFPTTVPEPATLTLLGAAVIPAFLRRRKKS